MKIYIHNQGTQKGKDRDKYWKKNRIQKVRKKRNRKTGREGYIKIEPEIENKEREREIDRIWKAT